MKKINLRLPDECLEFYRSVAEANGCSVNEAICMALSQYRLMSEFEAGGVAIPPRPLLLHAA